MTTEMWIIAAVGVVGSLLVPRWPLAGAFIAIFVDLSDLFLCDWIDPGASRTTSGSIRCSTVYMSTFLLVWLRYSTNDVLHVGQWFESFTATEALEAIWRFLTPPY